ncbi:MAG: response regulator [Deltaproteobacteria bacterium]|nr:response regulator [Deltaproteobacteria bacterium]
MSQEKTSPVIVLAIDDEPAIGRILGRALAEHCQSFHFTTNQHDAEEILKTHEVTHVIADYFMGRDMPTGVDLIPAWRARFTSIRRAIVLSGKNLSSVPIPREVDAVVGKPCSAKDLRAALRIS